MKALRARGRALVAGMAARQRARAGLVNLCGHHVCAPMLPREPFVVDLGANRGHFATTLAERHHATVLAVEPDPDLFAALPESRRLAKLWSAVGGEDGEITLHRSANPEANSLDAGIAALYGITGEARVPLRRLESLLAETARAPLRRNRIDLLKVDIEGAELAALGSLSDATLARIDQITVEFHDFLPGFAAAAELERLRARLETRGFLTLVLSLAAGHHGDVLFLRAEALPSALRRPVMALAAMTLPLERQLVRLGALLSA